MGRLDNKIAVVTGGGRHIGAGIAKMFAAEGARVTIASRTVEQLERTEAEIRSAGGDVLAIPTDLRSTEDVRRMIEQTVEHFGGLDVLVNNGARGSFGRSVEDPEFESLYDDLMATNLRGAFLGIHFSLPHLKARGGGSIINISSVHSIASSLTQSVYAASKGALVAGTKALSLELAPDLIRVNCISPGAIPHQWGRRWIERELGPEALAEYDEKFGRLDEESGALHQPLPVCGTPEDIAYCAVYLASDEARFVTGANFVVDGGLTARLGEANNFDFAQLDSLHERRREARRWFEEKRAQKEDGSSSTG